MHNETEFNCVKSYYAHFIANYFNFRSVLESSYGVHFINLPHLLYLLHRLGTVSTPKKGEKAQREKD